MKNFIRYGLTLSFFFMFSLPSSFAQAPNGLNTSAGDSTNFYFLAMTKYIETLKINKKNSSTLYIQADPSISQKLPKKKGHFTFKYINDGIITKLLKKSKKDLNFTRIIPVKILGPVLWVKIAKFNAAIDGDKVSYKSQGGLSLSFRFNCDRMEWEFLELKKSDD